MKHKFVIILCSDSERAVKSSHSECLHEKTISRCVEILLWSSAQPEGADTADKRLKNRMFPLRGKQEDRRSEGLGNRPAPLFMTKLVDLLSCLSETRRRNVPSKTHTAAPHSSTLFALTFKTLVFVWLHFTLTRFPFLSFKATKRKQGTHNFLFELRAP